MSIVQPGFGTHRSGIHRPGVESSKGRIAQVRNHQRFASPREGIAQGMERAPFRDTSVGRHGILVLIWVSVEKIREGDHYQGRYRHEGGWCKLRLPSNYPPFLPVLRVLLMFTGRLFL